jgi:hypothetical protein
VVDVGGDIVQARRRGDILHGHDDTGGRRSTLEHHARGSQCQIDGVLGVRGIALIDRHWICQLPQFSGRDELPQLEAIASGWPPRMT